jgi:teichuronic acid biosynthesis glycosyltransferase TuaC
VRQVLKGIQGCYLTTYEPEDVAQKITLALRATRPVCSREHIGQFDNRLIAGKLLQVYSSR